MTAAERDRTASRMAEYFDNRREANKPKFQGRRSNYDYGAKRRAALDRVGHKPVMVYGAAYRENFDAIFRR